MLHPISLGLLQNFLDIYLFCVQVAWVGEGRPIQLECVEARRQL